MHYTKINLAIEKQLVSEFREEFRKAKEVVQLVKEATEAEKQAAYTLGVEETQARLTEELSAVCRDYCDISWGKALDAAGVCGGDLRAFATIQKFASSQVQTPFTLNKPHRNLHSQRQIKSLMLPQKFQKIPTKMVA